MATIVEYGEDRRPVNGYPGKIVSPAHPSACCRTGMVQIGDLQAEGDWSSFYYKRCRHCGFTVRYFLALPAERSPEYIRAASGLFKLLATASSRTWKTAGEAW